MCKSANVAYVAEQLKDIQAVVNAAHPNAEVKVIIETCLLTDEEKVIACKLAKEAGACRMGTSKGIYIVKDEKFQG